MKLVVAVVRHEKVNDVLDELFKADVQGLTISEVRGHGGEIEQVETYRGTTVKMALSEKVRLEIGVSDHFVQPTVQAILRGASTGTVGDGKIFVLPVEKIYRIRTGEEDQAAVTPVTVGQDEEVAAHVRDQDETPGGPQGAPGVSPLLSRSDASALGGQPAAPRRRCRDQVFRLVRHRVEERHHRAQLGADLLERAASARPARVALNHGRPSSFSSIHFLANVPSWISASICFISLRVSSVTMRGAGGVVAVLGGVADRVAHVVQAAAIHQVDDQLQLVQALEVGDLRLVAGLDQRLEAGLDQLARRRRRARPARRTDRSRSPR